MPKMLFAFFAVMVCSGVDVFAATVAKKQSAIQNGTTVRARVEVSGIYNKDCYDAYYGCMDQFCMTDNENGGSCACSNKNAEYENQLAEVQKIVAEAERISTEEVERVRAGANADIIFNGSRQYDEKGNIVSVSSSKNTKESKAEKRASLLSMWDTNYDDDDDVFSDTVENISNSSCKFKVG